MSTTIDTIIRSVSTITYRLAPSAAAGICDDAQRAAACFADALGELYPAANVSVKVDRIDASSYDLDGDVAGEAFSIVRHHFGEPTLACDPDAIEVDNAALATLVEEYDRRAYEAAVTAANA